MNSPHVTAINAPPSPATGTPRPTPTPPNWIPPGEGVNWTAVGPHGWHTLTLPRWLGDRVLVELGEDGGAVIQDDLVHTMTWLIPRGAGSGRQLPCDVEVSGDDGTMIFVPGLARTRTTYWRTPPAPDRLLSDIDRLLEALDVVRIERIVRAGRGARRSAR